MSECVRCPVVGCVVEYLEGNAVQIALVTEEVAGRLRLLLPNRREVRLNAARLLPWLGPVLPAGLGRDDAMRALEAHKKLREALAGSIPLLETWELAQGEVSAAPAAWFAELAQTTPSPDQVSAYGRALLSCKSHFRFQPPDFQVFSQDMVEKRLQEEKIRTEREELLGGGNAFLRLLWDAACNRRPLPSDLPALSPQLAEKMEKMLRERMADPEKTHDDTEWRLLSKGLPDEPHLPLQLLTAWGKVPPHYNFWLERAGYAPGDAWWEDFRAEVESLAAPLAPEEAQPCSLPFFSIDSASTRDVDDALHICNDGDGHTVTLALALPALHWNFGGPLDRAVLRRGTSIYLPEGDCHMLPEILGTRACSLLAGENRPALCIRTRIDSAGGFSPCEIRIASVRLAANLTYEDCQAVLDAQAQGAPLPQNPATAHAAQLALGLEAARKRQAARIADGAVVMDRPEPHVTLTGEGADIRVDIEENSHAPDAQMLVAEMMILASAAVADWAVAQRLPLLHRVQDVALPREYAGVWSSPQDMTRIMRALVPSGLSVQARPHAALALPRYAPVTSPLRRYPDLVNEAQIIHCLRAGAPLWDEPGLAALLGLLSPVLEAAGQVQRFRPRYWKLLYFRQQGDKTWWPGVITEENDAFVSVSLPDQGIFVRGRRRLFDERACPGMAVRVRVGKVVPLYNEISVLEAAPAE